MVIKEIIYPIFFECSQFTDDSFWKNVFEDLVYAKAPYGTYMSNGFLLCGFKGKQFSYQIKDKTAKQLYNDIYNLLTKKVGILSGKENIQKRILYYQAQNRIKKSRKSWVDIRKKNIKDFLIEKYVIDMKKKFKLTIKQAKFLLSIIFIAFMFKILIVDDIHYSNNKIQNIDGIVLSTNNFSIEKNVYDIDVSFIPEITNEKKIMYDNWNKHLTSLRKVK